MADRWGLAVWALLLTAACGFAAAPAVVLSAAIVLLPEAFPALDPARGVLGAAADVVVASAPASFALASALAWTGVGRARGWIAVGGLMLLLAHGGAVAVLFGAPRLLGSL